jgi:hypothetical protein
MLSKMTNAEQEQRDYSLFRGRDKGGSLGLAAQAGMEGLMAGN